MMPQSTGPKVFDLSSVFPKLHFPMSVTPTRPTGNQLIKPGPNNTITGPIIKPPTKKN
jgi:hypothetical protein